MCTISPAGRHSHWALGQWKADIATRTKPLVRALFRPARYRRSSLLDGEDKLSHDFTIAIVTHNLQHAARLADQVAFFYLGELIKVGSTEQILTNRHQERSHNDTRGGFG